MMYCQAWFLTGDRSTTSEHVLSTTLRESNMATENGDFPIETSIHRGFSIAMFDYRRVLRNPFATYPRLLIQPAKEALLSRTFFLFQ